MYIISYLYCRLLLNMTVKIINISITNNIKPFYYNILFMYLIHKNVDILGIYKDSEHRKGSIGFTMMNMFFSQGKLFFIVLNKFYTALIKIVILSSIFL